MSDEPKFCKDCKHYAPPQVIPFGAVVLPDRCTHPDFRDLVTGVASARPWLMREGRCGVLGAMWEAKPPEQTPPPQVLTQAQVDDENARLPRATYQGSWWEFWK